MAQRGKIGQARHDNKVQQRLDYYKDKGFSVKADLPGRGKPPKIGGRIPDIIATKKTVKIVEEIETAATIDADRKQQLLLKNGAKRIGAKFRVIKAK